MAKKTDNPDIDTPTIEVEELNPEEVLKIEKIAEKRERIEQSLKSFVDEAFPAEEPPSEKIVRTAVARIFPEGSRSGISEIDDTQRKISRKMDEYDAAPTLNFVENNVDAFENRIIALASRGGPLSNRAFIRDLEFENFENVTSQIPLIRIKQILFSLPPGLVGLSTLKKVKWSDTTPVPEFDREGNYKDVSWHPEEDFTGGKVHPSRILIGHTGFRHDDKGKLVSDITMTRIPKTVTASKLAIFDYQVYVLLHEFIHSVLNPITHNGKTHKIRLSAGRNLQHWLDELRNSIVSGEEPVLTSDYAETFIDDVRSPDPEKYTPAMVELVCETFAAYLLNIMPNRHQYTSFEQADFGSREILDMHRASSRKTERYRLIKELCDSQFKKIK